MSRTRASIESMLAQPDIEARLARFLAVCRRQGVKITRQRLEVFRAVAATDAHPDADQVFRTVRPKLPTISLDTVYRTLWTLIDLGLLANLGPDQRRVRFDANLDPHHHFVCATCGVAVDFRHPAFDRLPVPKAVTGLGSIQRVQVEFRGVCARCQAADTTPPPRSASPAKKGAKPAAKPAAKPGNAKKKR
jgi:Fur family transcriptional regulator, peroxide stress response regulator